jgi:hypothetical protein
VLGEGTLRIAASPGLMPALFRSRPPRSSAGGAHPSGKVSFNGRGETQEEMEQTQQLGRFRSEADIQRAALALAQV